MSKFVIFLLIKAIFFLAFISPFQTSASGLANNIAFQHLLKDKDINLGAVLSIAQDKNGFIWLGCENNLVRYDGYTFKVMHLLDKRKPGDKKNILYSWHVIEDSKGVIWVASGFGLLHFDNKLGGLVQTPDHPSLHLNPLSGVAAMGLAELKEGLFAVATYSGLYILDPYSGEGTVYRSSQDNSIAHDRIRSVVFDGDDSLWVGVGSGFDRMSLSSRKFKHYKPYPLDPNSVPDNGVTSIAMGEVGELWLGTYRGLIKFDTKTEEIIRYEPEEGNPDSFVGGEIWKVITGVKGEVWIATDGKGLSLFDVKSQGFSNFLHESSRPSSLNSNVVRTVFVDKSGSLWAGNYPSGLNYFDRFSKSITNYTALENDSNSLSNKSVMSLATGAEGDALWIGTDGGGLNHFDRKSHIFRNFKYSAEDINTPGSDAILSLMVDSKNVLWGGTWGGGAFQMDLTDNRITRLPGDSERPKTSSVSHSMRLNNDKVWCIFEDSYGIIWICTNKGGLNRYDRNSKQFTHYIHSAEDPYSISGNHVWNVFEDSAKNLWVGTTAGLGILNRNTGRFSNFTNDPSDPKSLPKSSVHNIYEDRKSRIWLATNVGLKLYDSQTKSFTTYGIKQGFFNESIRSIVEDEQGWLWLSTNNGIVAFNPDSLQVKNYNRANGRLIGGINFNATHMIDGKEAAFGSANGLYILPVEGVEDSKPLPQVVLTDFQIFNEPVDIGGPNSPLDKPIFQTKKITLLPKYSVFSFEFSALNFSANEKIKYAYMLEGFDSKWNFIESRRTATYTNLDHGEYIFKAKAANNDGVWNPESTELVIVVLPQWWRTAWAYCLYFSIVLALLFLYRRNRLMQLTIEEKTNNLTLNRKLSQRTTKILEDERKSIAHEVHDNVNSTIIATRMIMQSIERLVQASEVNTAKIVLLTQKADKQLSETYDYFRSMLRKIRPEIIETLGFDGAIAELVDDYNSMNVSCDFIFELKGQPQKTNEEISINLYRIAQEAITNAIKHGAPSRVLVELIYEDVQLIMNISDNGSGYSSRGDSGLGVEHMRERALALHGLLSISAIKGSQKKGTLVKTVVPLR